MPITKRCNNKCSGVLCDRPPPSKPALLTEWVRARADVWHFPEFLLQLLGNTKVTPSLWVKARPSQRRNDASWSYIWIGSSLRITSIQWWLWFSVKLNEWDPPLNKLQTWLLWVTEKISGKHKIWELIWQFKSNQVSNKLEWVLGIGKYLFAGEQPRMLTRLIRSNYLV